jgi:hypothetical protein
MTEAVVDTAEDNPWAELGTMSSEEYKELLEVRKELDEATRELSARKAGFQSSGDVALKVEHLHGVLTKKMAGADKFSLEELVFIEKERIAAREQAQALHDAEKTQSGYKTLNIQPLSTLLKEDDLPLEWRIEGLMQIGHNVTMAARYKVGKTTFVSNLLKSLVDGTSFLGQFPVKQVTKPIVVFNHELSDRQFTAWLRKGGIRNTHMIIPINLRGKGLYLQDEEAQDWAIELLKSYEAEVWIIDPLQAALRGSVNDDNVASDWIAAADRVKAEAGVSELLLVTHTGHLSKADEYGRSSNERTAGSSRWAGWPDALWSYTKDEAGVRYLSAEGRDVEVEEFGLDYDEATMRLTSKGQDSGRVDAKQNEPFRKLMKLWADDPNAVFTRPQIERATRMNNKKVTDAILDAVDYFMIEETETIVEPGKRGRPPLSYKLRGEGKLILRSINGFTDN